MNALHSVRMMNVSTGRNREHKLLYMEFNINELAIASKCSRDVQSPRKFAVE